MKKIVTCLCLVLLFSTGCQNKEENNTTGEYARYENYEKAKLENHVKFDDKEKEVGYVDYEDYRFYVYMSSEKNEIVYTIMPLKKENDKIVYSYDVNNETFNNGNSQELTKIGNFKLDDGNYSMICGDKNIFASEDALGGIDGEKVSGTSDFNYNDKSYSCALIK